MNKKRKNWKICSEGVLKVSTDHFAFFLRGLHDETIHRTTKVLRDRPLSPSPVLSWAYGPQETVLAADTVTVTSPGGSKASSWASCWIDACLCVSLVSMVVLSFPCARLQGLLSP